MLIPIPAVFKALGEKGAHLITLVPLLAWVERRTCEVFKKLIVEQAIPAREDVGPEEDWMKVRR